MPYFMDSGYKLQLLYNTNVKSTLAKLMFYIQRNMYMLYRNYQIHFCLDTHLSGCFIFKTMLYWLVLWGVFAYAVQSRRTDTMPRIDLNTSNSRHYFYHNVQMTQEHNCLGENITYCFHHIAKVPKSHSQYHTGNTILILKIQHEHKIKRT